MHRALSSYSSIRRWRRLLHCIPVLGSLVVVLALSLSCDESLPPYKVPTALFKGTIYPRFVNQQGAGTRLWVVLTVQNTFDETLQGVASLVGELDIVLARDPSIHKTVALDSRSLLYHFNTLLGYPGNANVPNFAGGVLTINSGDSVRFFYAWDFTSDDSVYLPTQVFNMHEDPLHPGYFIAEPETLILTGYVQMFTQIGLVTFQPVEYILNYETSP